MAEVNDKIKKTSNVKQKSLRMSTRLQERVAVSQPAQSEPLDVVPTTSMDYNHNSSNCLNINNFKNVKMFTIIFAFKFYVEYNSLKDIFSTFKELVNSRSMNKKSNTQ